MKFIKNRKLIKQIIIFSGVVVIVLIYKNFAPTNILFPKCPVYVLTGIYCPGCGSQRAMHELFNLNLVKSLSYNILATLFILLLVVDFCFSLLKIEKFRPYKLLNSYRYSSVIVLIVILLFTVLRNIPVMPFTLLSP